MAVILEEMMKIKAVLFDLDGTLLPMDQELFVKAYFKLLVARLAKLGYAPDQLVDSIWKGVTAMIKNDGSCINEDAFWRVFKEVYGEEVYKDKPHLDAFYEVEFNRVQPVCGFTPEAKETVELVKDLGKMAVLATNPIFPAAATCNRMRWAGLEPQDFTLYTTCENSRYCKPDLQYYREILEQIGCDPRECLMVGNDVSEDMIVEELGMKVFLLTDCLINKEDKDISRYPRGGFRELKEYLRTV